MGKVHEQHFNTWSEWVDACERADPAGSSHNDDPDELEFFGATWDEAARFARGGWAEGAGRVGDLAATLTKRVEHYITEQAVEYDVTGEYVDVGAYLGGEPECMGTFVEREVPRRVVRIVANIGALGSVSTEAMENRGIAAITLVHALGKAGIDCEVVLATSGKPTRNTRYSRITAYVPVKRAGQTTNPGLLAFALVHPASLRRLVFAWREQIPSWGSDSGGDAYSGDAPDHGDICIPALNSSNQRTWENPDDVEAWVLGAIKAQGVELS